MSFKFELDQKVRLKVSGETGVVIGRADYVNSFPQCYVHFKDGNGCAKSEWFYENQLETIE